MIICISLGIDIRSYIGYTYIDTLWGVCPSNHPIQVSDVMMTLVSMARWTLSSKIIHAQYLKATWLDRMEKKLSWQEEYCVTVYIYIYM